MDVAKSALKSVEQAGHGGFEGAEEFRSRGSGAEVEQWEQTGGGEGFAVDGEAVAEFGSNHSGVFFLKRASGSDRRLRDRRQKTGTLHSIGSILRAVGPWGCCGGGHPARRAGLLSRWAVGPEDELNQR